MENAETDCREVLKRLYVYLDAELSAEERADIERHLEACAPCLQQFGFENEAKAIIGRKCRETEVPAGVAERLRQRLREIL